MMKNKATIQTHITARAISEYRAFKPSANANELDIFGVIGEDFWSWDYITLADVREFLAGKGDVIININSVGGSMFEGIAIYNLLKTHKGKVTVRVLGEAASAASLIAMAGDEIQIGASAYIMIHRAWVLASGNATDFLKLSDELFKFDNSMALIYKERTGIDEAKIEEMLNDETWLDGATAIELGFADMILGSEPVEDFTKNEELNALKKLDEIFVEAKVPRSERKKLLKAIKTQPNSEQKNTKTDELKLHFDPFAKQLQFDPFGVK